jgi:tetratricopeptide (TPR) repeat protein
VDPASLALAAAMVFGLLTADAAVSANSVAVSVSVPPAIVQTGFTAEVAERVFTSEFERMSRARSLLRAPSVRSAREPTIVGVIANALKLDNFTGALQDLLGLDHPRVNVAIVVPAPNRTRLLVNSVSARSGAFTVQVESDAGPEALLRVGAMQTMDQFEPYRSALFHFEQALLSSAHDFTRVKAVAQRELARPVNAGTLQENSYLQNLLGIVALMEDDRATAERFFRETFRLNTGFNVGRLNLGFALIELDRYREALDLLTPLVSVSLIPEIALPGRTAPLQEALHSTIGVARWGLGDLDGAEASFRTAVRAFPESEAAHVYWARLMRERGRVAEAVALEEIARTNALTFDNYPEVANLFFWMNPKDRQPMQRRASRVVRTAAD